MIDTYVDLQGALVNAQFELAGLAAAARRLDPDSDLVYQRIIAAGAELEQALALIGIEVAGPKNAAGEPGAPCRS